MGAYRTERFLVRPFCVPSINGALKPEVSMPRVWELLWRYLDGGMIVEITSPIIQLKYTRTNSDNGFPVMRVARELWDKANGPMKKQMIVELVKKVASDFEHEPDDDDWPSDYEAWKEEDRKCIINRLLTEIFGKSK